jgi:hypothetical protein
MKPRALRKAAFPFLAYHIDKANGDWKRASQTCTVARMPLYDLPRSNDLPRIYGSLLDIFYKQ